MRRFANSSSASEKSGLDRRACWKQFLGCGVISLALLDIAHVEQAGSVVRILLEPFLKIFPGFIESSQMPIGEPHEKRTIAPTGPASIRFLNSSMAFSALPDMK